MPAWTAFAAVSLSVLLVLLLLARASESAVTTKQSSAEHPTIAAHEHDQSPYSTTDVESDSDMNQPHADGGESAVATDNGRLGQQTEQGVSTGLLLANVAFSQGLFAGILIIALWLTNVPVSAIGADLTVTTADAVGLGVVTGLVLYILNELGASHAKQWGLTGSEALRGALTPDGVAGWLVLLFVVLPIIAGFEELLFRGILIGALHVGFDVPLWLLAIGSSVAFGVGHGAQGRVGMVVTGTLGLVLAWLFIVTNSLFAVIIAHYIVNALEFVIHEGIGWEPFETEP